MVDMLPDLHKILAIVGVLRCVPLRMRDDDSKAIPLLPATEGDCPREGCMDWGAERARNIDTMMKFLF